MAFEVVNGANTGNWKQIVQEFPNINRITNQVDITANKAVSVTKDEFVDEVDNTVF